jgi:hypothetical protein
MGSHSSSEEVEEQHSSDDTTTEVVHDEGEHDGEEAEEQHTASSEEDGHSHTETSHESEEHHENEDVPVEQRLRQLTDDLGRLDKVSSNDDETRQSFLSLSDLIKTLRNRCKLIRATREVKCWVKNLMLCIIQETLLLLTSQTVHYKKKRIFLLIEINFFNFFFLLSLI